MVILNEMHSANTKLWLCHEIIFSCTD